MCLARGGGNVRTGGRGSGPLTPSGWLRRVARFLDPSALAVRRVTVSQFLGLSVATAVTIAVATGLLLLWKTYRRLIVIIFYN